MFFPHLKPPPNEPHAKQASILVMPPKKETSSKATHCNPSHPAPQWCGKGGDKFLLP